jgi:predicted amidohydrolase YtcJ
VLSDNPLKIDPLKIADIKVLETIKEGRSVYRRKSAGRRS